MAGGVQAHSAVLGEAALPEELLPLRAWLQPCPRETQVRFRAKRESDLDCLIHRRNLALTVLYLALTGLYALTVLHESGLDCLVCAIFARQR